MLGKAWTAVVAVCFVLLSVGFAAVQAERYGWLNVALLIALFFVFGLWRAWPTDPPSRAPSTRSRPRSG